MATADPVRDAMASLLKDSDNVRRAVLRQDVEPTSAARHELDEAERALGSREAVERVIRLVDVWAMVQAEQLQGIGVILADGTTVFPMFPLLRASVEHGAAICWLLDPKVGSRDRAIRAALSQLRSDMEIAGVVKRWVGTDDEAYGKVKSRLERTRASIRRDFDSFDHGTGTIEGQRLPMTTAIVEHFGTCQGDARQWTGTYAFLCGTGNHPSENAFEFVEVNDGKPYLSLSGDFVNRMVRIGFAAYTHSLEHLASYLDWPREAIRAYKERAGVVLGETSQ